MRTWREILMVGGLCAALCGCGSFVNVAGNMDAEQTKAAAESERLEAAESLQSSGACVADGPAAGVTVNYWTEENRKKEIAFLEEHFSDGLEFSDMDAAQAESYGSEIGEYYEFVGRETEDGFGYVLGFLKGEENPFEGRSQFWNDGIYTIAEYVELEDGEIEEQTLYSMEEVEFINLGEDFEIIFLQPISLGMPEELQMAFSQRHCNGEEGRAYLQDVMEREVRLTAPDDGAYLEVYRYEDGRRRREFIPLTAEEEAQIMESDALIQPDWYGGYGLQFFVSQETYEATGEEKGPITAAALSIVEERCAFEAMNLSEIHDIVKAEMHIERWDWEEGSDTTSVEITDPEQLAELEAIFAGAEASAESKCPYRAVVTLTREDGETLTLTLATDSCDGFIYGSIGSYYMGNAGAERVWEIFHELREDTGWMPKTEP